MSPRWSLKMVYGARVLLAVVIVYVLVWAATTVMENKRDNIDRTTTYLEKFVAAFTNLSILPKALTATATAEEPILTKIKMAIVNPPSEGLWYNLLNPHQTYFSEFAQDSFVAKLFRQKRNGTFFEVGALDGEFLSNTLYLERSLGWSGLLVEPGSASFATLKSKRRQRARLLRACLSLNTTAGEFIFDTKGSNDHKLASLAKVDVKHLQFWEKVPCYPLYTVLRAMMGSDDVVLDYLSLDIEGDELKVLKTVPWNRVQIRFMTVEKKHVPEGAAAVRLYMESQGYVFEGLHGADYFFYHPDYKHELDLHS